MRSSLCMRSDVVVVAKRKFGKKSRDARKSDVFHWTSLDGQAGEKARISSGVIPNPNLVIPLGTFTVHYCSFMDDAWTSM